MKTFETEKGNIPEGATHYMNQTSYTYFAWGKFVGENLYIMLASESEWTSVSAGMFDDLKPIPQTKEVEWVNGDACRYNEVNWLFCGFHPVNGLAIVANNDNPASHQVITVDVELLSKPETEAERKERERVEAVEEMFTHWSDDKRDFVAGDDDDRWVKEFLFSLHDAGYKKVSL